MTTPPPSGDAQYTPPSWDGAAAGYPSAPAHDPAAYPVAGPGYAVPQTSPPGQVLGIVGFVLSFIVAPIGLILSIIAAVKLSRAGASKGLAVAGIIIGALITALWVIGIVLFVTVFANLIATCGELGPGVWHVDGVTYTCS